MACRSLGRIDSVGLARPRELGLLRALPIFAPLGTVELEQLAVNLCRCTRMPAAR